jgi:hypothetical protein
VRFPLCCSDCVDEGTSIDESTVFVPPNDNSIYEVTCSRGHKTLVVVVEARHEQLFEIGLSAILDLYHREAVSSFAAALERFYEFAIGVFATHAGVTEEAFQLAWKPLAKQSERQLGAFVGAYLMAEQSAPTLLAPKASELRNAVVHKGKIPSREEAINFGDAVLKVIRETLVVLRKRYAAALHDHSRALHLGVLKSPALVGKKVTRHSLAMALRDLDTQQSEGKATTFYLQRMQQLERGHQ